MEWYQSINHGQLFPLFSFNYFHGSAVMSMYPYLGMLPFIILLKITSSFIVSYYAFFVLIIFSSLLISFFSSLHYSYSVLISYIFSITYSMSSLFTFKMFTDGDLGVATSLMFLPLVIFGFLDILRGSKNYLKISLGIVLMTYCQIASVSIITLLLCGWLLFDIKWINKDSFINFVKAACLSILLTSIVWIPIIYISLFNKTNTVVQKRLTGFSIKFFVENMSPFAVIAIILGWLCFGKFNRFNRQMYIISIIVIVLSSKLTPWHLITSLPILNLLNQFQFTFRFLIIPQILLSYLFSVSSYIFLKRTNKLKIWGSLLVLSIIFTQIFAQTAIVYRKSNLINTCFNNYKEVKEYELNRRPHRGDLFSGNKSMNYFVNGYTTNRDYYPKQVNKYSKYVHNYKGFYGNNEFINVKHDGYNRFSFLSPKQINHLVMPLLYYNNEHLRITLNHHIINFSHKHHLIVINNVKRGQNILRIQYVPNILFLILIISMILIGLIWLMWICIIDLKNRNNLSRLKF